MTEAANIDRSQCVPQHCGDHVLPNSPLFGKLIRHARRGRVALRDRGLGVEKTYGELLDAVLAFRKVVEASLSPDTRARLRRGDEVYIGVLAAGGLEFTVAILAVLALGAAAVPMFPTAPVNELVYFITKSQQVAVLASSATTDTAQRAAQQAGNVLTIDILSNLPESPRFRALDMAMSSDPPQDDRAPGIVIFTSGTTGRPKAVVHRRTYTHETATSIGEGYDVDHRDVLLHLLPVHHTTGLGTSFFPFLCAGACIEFRGGGGGFDAAWVWDRFAQGGLTVFSAVPTIFMRLKWDFERRIAKLAPEEVARYVAAANRFRVLLCGSSALQDHVQRFWTELRAGTPILTRYGATEFPGCLKVPLDADHQALPKGCVGLPVPGVELKLSESNEGELLVKSPYMFAKYLYDPEATRLAHDEDGWFKTGDIARRDGDFYTIVGRASVDIIKSGGYKISAIDIERECLNLPYVREAMVVGVRDEELGQRVGAVIAVKPQAANLTLQQLRADLRKSLANYKLPTILRVVEGELPKGVTGKLQKKVLGPELIPSPGYERLPGVQVWRRSQEGGRLQARM
ncbi:AMP-binding enzyme domain-containing protein [Cladophialophora immunda]|nr:AMP-binding enzyme domain-containing protein [Cladophialophora immunda]